MSAKLILAKSAVKQYKKIPSTERKKILKRLDGLADNPLMGKKLNGDLEGSYSLRTWPYRIVYLFDSKKNQVQVVAIVHRQGAYK
jgi:mRNA-degrading endonuclease RelE of RelBE toxin-antitoxin system